jgi:glycosyltransferase involved in cell wall biosynthesis
MFLTSWWELYMRIAVVDDAGFGLGGGRGVYGKEVYSGILSAIYKDSLGFDVVRVLLGEGISEFEDVVKIVGSKTPIIRALYDRRITRQLTKVIKEKSVGIIHANIINPRYVNPLIAVKKRLGIKLVTTVHSWAFVCPTGWKIKFPEMRPCNIKAPSIRCVKCIRSMNRILSHKYAFLARGLFLTYSLHKLVRNSDLVIVPSKELSARLSEEVGLDNVVHIPNPVNPQLLKVEPIPPESNITLFIGRLDYSKGAHLLPKIAELIKPVELHVVGQGPLRGCILRNPTENLIFHGYVSNEEKIALLRKTSVVVVPSIWHELYGYVVVEAFSVARPVVAFSLGGPKELVESSGAGLLASPYDLGEFSEKVKSLALDKERSFEMGLKGRKYVEEDLIPKKYAERLQRVFRVFYE